MIKETDKPLKRFLVKLSKGNVNLIEPTFSKQTLIKGKIPFILGDKAKIQRDIH